MESAPMESRSTESLSIAGPPVAAAPHGPATCDAAGRWTLQPGPVPGVPSELQLALTARWT